MPLTHTDLSERELMVFTKLGAGERCSQIAHDHLLSIKTVSTYRVRALRKLGLATNRDIAGYCVANGLK